MTKQNTTAKEVAERWRQWEKDAGPKLQASLDAAFRPFIDTLVAKLESAIKSGEDSLLMRTNLPPRPEQRP